jgi:hypothetical protein
MVRARALRDLSTDLSIRSDWLHARNLHSEDTHRKADRGINPLATYRIKPRHATERAALANVRPANRLVCKKLLKEYTLPTQTLSVQPAGLAA